MKAGAWGGKIALLITTVIWGFAFAVQKNGMDYLSPMVFSAVRMLLGIAVLLPVIALLDRLNGRKVSFWGLAQTPGERRMLIGGGAICGAVLGLAITLQQYGLIYASAGKSGFLSVLYIVLVPIFGLLLGRKTPKILWFAVLLALTGTWLLSSPEGFSELSKGDFLLIGCAAGFAAHILVIDHFVPHTDCVRLSCLQFGFAGLYLAIGSLCIGDSWEWDAIVKAAIPLGYCGFFSLGAGYTLQTVGQKYLHPVTASLWMSLESVFAAVGGYLILGERLSGRELAGCAIIFVAVILVQLPEKKHEKNKA